MDPTSAMAAVWGAMEVDGINHSASTAGTSFRAELENMYTTDYILTKAEVLEIQLLCGYAVRPLNKRPRPSCHWQLAVLRDMLRKTYCTAARPETTRAKTLVIASAHREISKYWKNPNVEFYVYGKEGKDNNRVVMSMLEDIRQETAARNLIPHDIEEAERAGKIPKTKRRAILTINDLEQMIAAYQLAKDGEVSNARIHVKFPVGRKYDQILVEDGHYNFRRSDWLSMFDKTGATRAYVIGMFPYEMMFPGSPKSQIYRTVEQDKPRHFNWMEVVRTALGAIELSTIGRDGSRWLITVVAAGFFLAAKDIKRRDYDTWVRSLIDHFGKYEGYARTLGILNWHARVVAMAQEVWDTWHHKMVGTEIVMTYHGHSNGYIHDRDAMFALLDDPCMSQIDYNFALHNEIVHRLGPMMMVQITRADLEERVVRSLCLAPNERYVEVLDIFESYDFLNKVRKTPVYIPVFYHEYFDVIDFLAAQKPEVITPQLAMTMVRRASAGLSLGKTVLTPRWRLDNAKLFSVAVNAAVAAIRRHDLAAEVVGPEFIAMIENSRSRWTKMMATITGVAVLVATCGMAIPIFGLADWLATKTVETPLMRMGTDEIMQTGGAPAWAAVAKQHGRGQNSMHYEVAIDVDRRSEVTRCSIEAECDFIKTLGDMGKQDPICMHARGCAGTETNLSMTASEIAQLRADLVQSRDAAANDGLAKVLDKLIDKLEVDRNGYEFSSRIELVRGPPGVGKSYTMRSMMDTLQNSGKAVAVHSPFGKLATDYTVEANGKGPFPFYTTHKLYQIGKLNVMIVEEYTNMDERLIAYMAYKTGAQTIVMVGDESQTGLMPTEGERPFLKDGLLRLDQAREHILPKNFRSDAYTVALLNAECGYCLYAENEAIVLPQIVPTSECNPEAQAIMTFSRATARHLQQPEGDENTVRRNQGQTHDGTAIYLRDGDENMVRNDALFCVAVSRRKVGTGLTIYADTSEVEAAMRNRLRLDDPDFIANIGQLSRPDYRAHYERIRSERFGPDVEATPSGWHAIMEDYAVTKVVDHTTNDDVEWANRFFEKAWAKLECEDTTELSKLEEKQKSDVNAPTTSQGETQKLPEQVSNRRTNTKKELNEIRKTFGLEWCTLDAMGVAGPQKNYKRKFPQSLMLEYAKAMIKKTPEGETKIALSDLTTWLEDKKIPWLIYDSRDASITGDWTLGDTSDFEYLVEYDGQHIRPMSNTLFSVLTKPRILPAGKETSKSGAVVFHLYEPLLAFERRGRKLPVHRAMLGLRFIDYVASGSYETITFDGDTTVRDAIHEAIETGDTGFIDGLVERCEPRLLNPDRAGGLGLFGPDEIVKHANEVELRNDLAVVMADENSYSAGCMTWIERGDRLPEQSCWERETPQSCDGYVLAGEVDPTVGTGLRTNAIGAAMGPSKQIAGMTLRRDPLYARFDKKGRHLSDSQVVTAFGGGFGNTQTDATIETLGSAERYLVKPKGGRPSVQGRRHAVDMANRTYKRGFDDYGGLTSDAQSGIHHQFIGDAKARSYDVRALGLALKGTVENLMTFTNKVQFKWGKTADPIAKQAKVGQGICAASSAINLRYGELMRQADHEYATRAKHWNIYDCYMSPDQLIDRVNTEVSRLPSCATVMTTDVEEFDANQNWHSARAEARLNSLLLGHVESFEQYVEEVRTGFPISAPGLFSGRVQQAKGSGLPDTLGGNTRTSEMYTDELIEGRGPMVKVKKGDDLTRVQYGMKINRDKAAEIARYSPLTFKIVAGDTQFCGMSMTDGGLYDNIVGFVKKALGHGDREYKTWAEYQISLRDKMNSIRKRGLVETVIATSRATGTTIEYVWRCYAVFQSLCHISKAQWEAATVSVERNYPAPRDARFIPRPF